jgi:hypothetical protein
MFHVLISTVVLHSRRFATGSRAVTIDSSDLAAPEDRCEECGAEERCSSAEAIERAQPRGSAYDTSRKDEQAQVDEANVIGHLNRRRGDDGEQSESERRPREPGQVPRTEPSHVSQS